VSCTQPFTAAAGDRLILRLQLGPAAETDCAQVESVEDWAASRTGPTGIDYIGLTKGEAEGTGRRRTVDRTVLPIPASADPVQSG
jgi:hypothetical protein